MLAGPPGAGKSTVLRDVLGLDKGAWLTIDADEFKHKLLREALRDGSYDQFLRPPEVAQREQVDGERFFPLELASLVHEESAHLAQQLQREAMREGTNIVVDSVLSTPDWALELGQRLEAAGYTVEVIDVEVPYELSQERIAGRWRDSYQDALTTGSGLGGRWVPSVYARSVFDTPTGRSKSQDSAAHLAQGCGAVERYRRFWTPSATAARVVEVDQSRRLRGEPLVDTDLLRGVTWGSRGGPAPRTRPSAERRSASTFDAISPGQKGARA